MNQERPNRHTQALRHQGRLPLVAVVLLALALAACFGDGADDIQAVAEGDTNTVADYPDWIEKVYPPPGSELSATQAVQVNHTVTAADRQVRLVIDGTDVTTYSMETSPGLLEYDDDEAELSPVPLDPGEHTAVVELVRVDPGAQQGNLPEVHEVVERFTWSFNVL